MKLEKYPLLQQGIYVDRITSIDRIQGLIQRLHPVKTQFPLIRLGSDHDGGYLVPDDLGKISTCFSPGVDVNASFEKDLLDIKKISSHLADYSVDGPPKGFIAKSFTKKYLGAFNSEQHITLDQWVDSQEPSSLDDFILQMDIEGGEYTTLLGASEKTINKFRIIIVEIHAIESWAQTSFFSIAEGFFMKLLKNFHVVHNHPNNCCGIVNIGGILLPRVFELTLLRKDRATAQGFCDSFPHPEDRPNLTDRPDLLLPTNWYAPMA